MDVEKQPLVPAAAPRPPHRRRERPIHWLMALAIISYIAGGLYYARKVQLTVTVSTSPKSHPTDLERFQACSIKNMLATGLPFLDSAKPLPVDEFVERRDRLAIALAADGVDAFVVEPGYTFKYYANVSQSEWEVWEHEERPFLMIVRPDRTDSGSVSAKTTFLAPAFEAERVRLLGMPLKDSIDIVTWEEHWDPYETLYNSSTFKHLSRTPKIMVDEEMRDFIQRGLGRAGFDVVGLGGEVERVRQTKSTKEIEILRAVNTGTVEAVRQIRKCMKPGFSENEVKEVLDNTLRAAGLDPFFDIVLFDDDASNPHGGTDGSKTLAEETLVLVDVGAHLYGYSSDICRTFFPSYVPEPKEDMTLSRSLQEKLKVWDIVFEAQSASLREMKENHTAASVDIAARKVISDAGYGEAFTHRVGHGIGIKAHESPYLNKGNTNVSLKAGMVFTSEPGIYLIDRFGVRHEDIFLVQEEAEPELLTGSRAKSAWEP